MSAKMKRREFIAALGGATVSSHSVWAQQADSRVADLVRAGKIRVALFLPLYAKDPVTGELRGNLDGVFLIEIIRALAARLGVETQVVGYPTPPEAMNAIKAGACDVGFFGIDPVRAAERRTSRRHWYRKTIRISCRPAPQSTASQLGPARCSHCGRAQSCLDRDSEPCVEARRAGICRNPGHDPRTVANRASRCNGISPSPASSVFRPGPSLTGAGRPIRRAHSCDGGSQGPARPACLHQRVC
jgi:hypothetical protein